MRRYFEYRNLCQLLLVFLFACPCVVGASELKHLQATNQALPASPGEENREETSFIHARFLGLSKDGKHARYRLDWVSTKKARSFKGLIEFLDSSGRRLLGFMIPHDSGVSFTNGKPYIGETTELWTPTDLAFLKYAGKNPKNVKMRFTAWHIVFSDGSEFHWP